MRAVHLTFDNGPDPVGAPLVLDALRARGLTATFFVLGKHLATPEGLQRARQILHEGHRLGNHSYTHETPLGLDPRPDAVARELAATQALLDPLGPGERWFRPFGGGGVLGPHLLSPAALAWLEAEGMTCVLWNSVPRDWEDADGWVERALADARAPDPDPLVVVLHDIAPAAMAHLGRFLDALLDAGHPFTHDLPVACTPVVAGVRQPGWERFVAGGG